MEQHSTAPRAAGQIPGGVAEERLHRLSTDTAQRVLERAIADQPPEDLGLTRSDLLRIAQELDIDPAALERALADEMSTSPRYERPGLLARITGLGRLRERRMSQRPVPSLERAAVSWLAGEEGLRLQRRTPDGAVWIADGRLTARLRLGLRLTKGTRTLRAADRVVLDVVSLGGGRSLVDMRVDATGLLAKGRTVALAGTAAGIVLFLVGWMAGALSDAAGAGSLVVVLSWTATVVALRGWGRRLAAALATAVEVISSPAIHPWSRP
jgi:hypothetical protein